MTDKLSATRSELMFLLTWASELEHSLACTYLYSAMSLKAPDEDATFTPDEGAAVKSWKDHLVSIAIDEMGHLAQVSNLLTSIGGSPHFNRAPFPQPAAHYPLNHSLSLEPYTTVIADRFACYEAPEPGILDEADQAELEIVQAHSRKIDPLARKLWTPAQEHDVEPYVPRFTTVADLYRHVEALIDEGHAAGDLFIGGTDTQASPSHLRMRGSLHIVAGPDSAKRAIEQVIAEGEAPTKSHPDAHFWVFRAMATEYGNLLAKRADFKPYRPVVANPVTDNQAQRSHQQVITAPMTHDAAEIFNMSYDTLLLGLIRLFAHVEESEDELQKLATTSLKLMSHVIMPLGEALTKMPAFPDSDLMAGPTFGYANDIHFLPHKTQAWTIIGERLKLAAESAATLGVKQPSPEWQQAVTGLQAVAMGF